jgi:tRNA 2-thiouridine synthesizing protein A
MAEVLDARGLKCPLPVLKARRALKALPAGASLDVLADDPAAPADFRSFSHAAGYRLETLDEPKGWRFRLSRTD